MAILHFWWLSTRHIIGMTKFQQSIIKADLEYLQFGFLAFTENKNKLYK